MSLSLLQEQIKGLTKPIQMMLENGCLSVLGVGESEGKSEWCQLLLLNMKNTELPESERFEAERLFKKINCTNEKDCQSCKSSRPKVPSVPNCTKKPSKCQSVLAKPQNLTSDLTWTGSNPVDAEARLVGLLMTLDEERRLELRQSLWTRYSPVLGENRTGLVRSCSFKGRDCLHSSSWTSFTHPKYGNCFTFNSKLALTVRGQGRFILKL